ncbi:nucleoside-diphosphate sugar epimerase/dehydratase [Marivivens sp. LCG002]|uniref:nucleoside-diphosphate sugar epimerase/dehydratase n=1 Tax=Marivivens sp. LCG002 TaxID=3051171 RepID=UPI0025575653|nr:nucleoside-diphosphate sugar epimerase/dehydratase [Marivivens sp. LCG002]WIV51423.1 nucleoside-diphosphate sugar epimerase/dehydratase [Marivivens sp. LCG002]
MVEHFLHSLFALTRTEKRIMQILTDSTLIVVCFYAALAVQMASTDALKSPSAVLMLLTVIPLSLAGFVKLGFYRAIVRYMSSKALRTVIYGVGLSALWLFAIGWVFSVGFPMSVVFIYAMLLFMTVGGSRLILRNLYHSLERDARSPVAIYGAGAAGRQLVNALSQSKSYRPVILIDDNPALQNSEIGGLSVISFEQAHGYLKKSNVKTILLALPSLSQASRRAIIERLEGLKVEVKTMPGLSDLIEGRAQISTVRDISIEELLGRDPIPPKAQLMERNIRNKVVLVTGAGGSIGSELCRQILRQNPKKLLLLDSSEYALYSVHDELTGVAQAQSLETTIIPIICSVQNQGRVQTVLSTFKVQTIYHAAAYKHVPLVELNVIEGMRNNIFGTKVIAEAAISAGVESFTLISTDKAVRPTNFMGASKRMAELVCQAYARSQSRTIFSMVRFGNVLGSSGSVIPRFTEQIKTGGPITVTHKEINRFFMTIPEAAQLVIQASSMAKGGEVFVLDMGEPVKIIDLAQKMARLHGLTPFIEEEGLAEQQANLDPSKIAIRVVGLRPGEKLYEELLIGNDPEGTEHPRIMSARETYLELSVLNQILEELFLACKAFDIEHVRELLQKAPTDFAPVSSISDLVWDKNSKSALKPKLTAV